MKHLLRLSIATTLLLLGWSCQRHGVRPQFSVLSTDTLLTCGPVRYTVEYRFTSLANATASSALQAIEESNIYYFYGLEGFTGTATEAASLALQQLREETEKEVSLFYTPSNGFTDTTDSQPRPQYEYRESIDSEVAIVDTVLVYTITSSSYTGGAHGMYTTTLHNYSLRGGYELTLRDLLSEAQLSGLDSLIRTRLYDLYQVTDDGGLADLGFFPDEIRATENFACTQTGLTFYYNPYDIGCYALGDITLSLTHEELNALGQKK